ncbi:MAG TPA: lamin tail domain-containing protein [Saprospiraceae bacterium]|nr:lamin tail domain-containing protein [Saprospiraceae bacterium]
MKNKLLALLITLISISAQAQIVINEIMYNPPESGTDYLEYIEFYNTTNSQISLKDYKIKEAVGYTFPDTFIRANAFYVICGNQVKFDSIFGFKAAQWASGALSNAGELITLLDAGGNVVDSVRYSNSNLWPVKSNGQGSSLELCTPGIDNGVPEVWKASNAATIHVIDGKALFGSPNKANAIACADHAVLVSSFMFTPSNLEIFEGEYVEWRNTGGTHNVNGNLATFPGNPEGFGNGPASSSSWTYIKRFDKTGVYQYQCDPHATQMRGTITVKPKSSSYPIYPVGVVSSINASGDADSIDVVCQLDGTVYGVNLRPQGLQFTLIDEFNDGIAVFSPNKNFGYTVKEGDKISVRGIIAQFNGLIQITPLNSPDTIIYVSSGNSLVSPTEVSSLNEITESQLITIKNVRIENPLTWSNNPTGFTTKVTDGVNSYDIRIDNDVELVSLKAPTGTFDITGIGSQFDASSPYFDGYQLMPRYAADINPYITEGNVYSKQTIAKVSTENANGVADSLGLKYELQGIVYGIDFNGTAGLQFTMGDATGGIGVFSVGKDFGYTVKEGDEIVLRGKVDQFRGLTQIAADTLWKLSSGNPLKQAKFVTELSEATESELVRLNSAVILDPADWIGNGNSFNVKISVGGSQFIMRIDDNCDLSNTVARGVSANITGIGSQFDDSNPFTEGYQIFPRYKSDIEWYTAVDRFLDLAAFVNSTLIHDQIQVKSDYAPFTTYALWTADGRMVKQGKISTQISVSELAEGLYVLEFKSENKRGICKLVKQ